MLSFGALIPTMAANVFFPAIGEIKSDLNASDAQISLSISLYILAQVRRIHGYASPMHHSRFLTSLSPCADHVLPLCSTL